MRSIIYSANGDPSVLQLVEREIPEPGPGEVRVKLAFSGVNPTDWKTRRGGGPSGAMPFPEVVPNLDGAGVIDAVGPTTDDASTTTFAVGDRVWVYLAAHESPLGTAQEFTVQPVARVVPLPDAASFELGASLGVPAMTAHRALTVAQDGPTRLSPGALDGRTVLVQGGAGAVGNAAIQLARWAGATVVSTISNDEKAALATAAGAHHVVNYREGDTAAAIREVAPQGVDLVVEVAIAQNLELDQAVLAPRGTVVSYANNGGDQVTLDIRPHMGLNTRLQFMLLYTVGDAALQAAAEDVTAAIEAGALDVGREHGLPLTVFPLADTAGAHAAVEDDTVGKVLIDVTA
ncbi:NADPH:quinone reductase [Plantibacter sp. LMC-P-059a]|uniref:NADPH:quinone reductase n=1 Tax=Plantibacter sp. LMC-P-059a TaxID=3040297 RepID=UPI00254D56F7|nr:NADPH:quinone reductase [Plantibacter sp. LMC-P-059a]